MCPTFQEAQSVVLNELLVLVKLCDAQLTFKWSNSKGWILRVDINQGLCFMQEHVLILLYATSLLKLLHRRVSHGHLHQGVIQLREFTSFIKFHGIIPCGEVRQRPGWYGWQRGNKGQNSKLPIIWAGKPATRTRFHLGA